MIEKQLSEFRYADGGERQQGGRPLCELGIDLRGNIHGVGSRVGDLSAYGAPAFAVVKPPRFVVGIDGHFPDANSRVRPTGPR
jgi:hypothetical protein